MSGIVKCCNWLLSLLDITKEVSITSSTHAQTNSSTKSTANSPLASDSSPKPTSLSSIAKNVSRFFWENTPSSLHLISTLPAVKYHTKHYSDGTIINFIYHIDRYIYWNSNIGNHIPIPKDYIDEKKHDKPSADSIAIQENTQADEPSSPLLSSFLSSTLHSSSSNSSVESLNFSDTANDANETAEIASNASLASTISSHSIKSLCANSQSSSSWVDVAELEYQATILNANSPSSTKSGLSTNFGNTWIEYAPKDRRESKRAIKI